MIFTKIPDVPAFLQAVGRCAGNVTYIEDGGNTHDLKKIASRPVAWKPKKNAQIEINVDNRHDRARMVRFMMDMNYMD